MPGAMKSHPWHILVLVLGFGNGLFMPWAQADRLPTPMQAVASGYQLSDEFKPGDVYMGIRLLGSLKLAPVEPQGLPMMGLSGLAFDEDENTLYALSDQGRIYHLRPYFENTLLKDVSVLGVYHLRNKKGQPLKGRKADSEGMLALNARNMIRGDTELVITFERKHRILRFSTEGHRLEKMKLPPKLADKQRYRSANKGIESVVLHPRYGFLAAPEKALKGASAKVVDIVALDQPNVFWRYPLAAEPSPALVGMELLTDGALLTLERAHGSFYIPFITTIRRIPTLPPNQHEIATIETVARMSTSQGWNIDNFEGLARHNGNRFFMISDDNGMIYQSTLLSYFEVLEHDQLQGSKSASGLKSHQQTPEEYNDNGK